MELYKEKINYVLSRLICVCGISLAVNFLIYYSYLKKNVYKIWSVRGSRIPLGGAGKQPFGNEVYVVGETQIQNSSFSAS